MLADAIEGGRLLACARYARFLLAEVRIVDRHAFRSILPTWLQAAGQGETITKTMARHARIETTLQHYTDTERFDLHGAIWALPLPASPEDLPGRPWLASCQSDAPERTSSQDEREDDDLEDDPGEDAQVPVPQDVAGRRTTR